MCIILCPYPISRKLKNYSLDIEETSDHHQTIDRRLHIVSIQSYTNSEVQTKNGGAWEGVQNSNN